jgi:hypothetical protein
MLPREIKFMLIERAVTQIAFKELRLVSRDTNFHHPDLYCLPMILTVRHGVEL